MLQGFINTHDSVKTETTNEAGNQVISYELVPRGLVQVNQKEWEDPEFLFKMLGLRVGTKTYQGKNGTLYRDLFFAKVKPSNSGYKWLKIGQLCSKVSQDPETGDEKEVFWFKGFEPKPQKPTEEPQDDAGDAKEEEEAQAQVDSI